jgi:hypothetical protein
MVRKRESFFLYDIKITKRIMGKIKGGIGKKQKCMMKN